MTPGEAILTTLLQQSSLRSPQRSALAEWQVDDLPPTLAKSTQCEACGHPIKRTVKLFNGATHATLIVGYDCYEHFVALSKGFDVAFSSISELRKEREHEFERIVERGHIGRLKKAAPLDAGTWSRWMIAQKSKTTDPLVLAGIEALSMHGFIISRRQLDACICHHDDRRRFQAALVFGNMWPKFAASAQSEFTISEGRALFEAHELAKWKRETNMAPAPSGLPVAIHSQSTTSALAATAVPRPALSPAAPRRRPYSVPVVRIGLAPGAAPTRQPRKGEKPRTKGIDKSAARSRPPKPSKPAPPVVKERQQSAQLVRRGSGFVEPVSAPRPVAQRPAEVKRPPTPKSAVDPEEHAHLRAQAMAVLESQDTPAATEARLLRSKFMSQISRVEAASAQGKLAESTRPLDEIRAALQRIERQLGMR